MILRQEAVKLRLQDIEFPHFIQLSCFTKCHRCALASTPNRVTRLFTTSISEWDFLYNQRKALERWQGGNNHFEKYFHLFTIIWNLVNLVKWQFWRISHDLATGESQDIGSCQNWNLREMIWGFSNFETKIHIWRGTRDELDRVVCCRITCGQPGMGSQTF